MLLLSTIKNFITFLFQKDFEIVLFIIQETDPSSRRECWYHSSFPPGTPSVGDYQQGRRNGTSPRVEAWGGRESWRDGRRCHPGMAPCCFYCHHLSHIGAPVPTDRWWLKLRSGCPAMTWWFPSRHGSSLCNSLQQLYLRTNPVSTIIQIMQ